MISLGEFKAAPPDQLWLFDGAAGTATELADSTASFDIGYLVHDRARNQLLLADAETARPRVRVFGMSGEALSEKSAVEVNPSRGLPPRYMAWY